MEVIRGLEHHHYAPLSIELLGGGMGMTKRRRLSRRQGAMLIGCVLLLAGSLRIAVPEQLNLVLNWIGADRIPAAVDALGHIAAGTAEVQEVFSALSSQEDHPESPDSENGVQVISGNSVEARQVFTGKRQDVLPVLVVHDLSVGFNEEDLSDDTSDAELPDKVDLNWYEIPFATVTPVNGAVTSDFGYRDHPVDGIYKFHYGIDIAAAQGVGILSFADGIVEEAGVSTVNGNYLRISHKSGFTSLYAHCEELFVSEGETVSCGQKVASVGRSGTATGYHLHFQIYHKGKLVDPLLYVQP